MSELLKKRFKAIAIDTSGNFEVGEVFYADSDGKFTMTGDHGAWHFHPESFPHLFRKLEWWEERKPDELPAYVKTRSGITPLIVSKLTRIDFEDTSSYNFFLDDEPLPYRHSDYVPASEEEYAHYKKKHK